MNLQLVIALVISLALLGFLLLKIFVEREMTLQEGLPIAFGAGAWAYIQIRLVAYGNAPVHSGTLVGVLTFVLIGQYYWRHPPHRESAIGRKLKQIAREKGITK